MPFVSNSNTNITFQNLMYLFGVLWNLADKLFFQKHMTQLLIDWNPIVKEFEESNKWKELMAG